MSQSLKVLLVMAATMFSLSAFAVEDGKMNCRSVYEKTDVETLLLKAHVLAVKNLNNKAILKLEEKMAKIELDAKDCNEYTKNSRDFLIELNTQLTSFEKLTK